MLYFNCKMGAAGDMIMGALFELLSNSQKSEFLVTMNGLFPNDVSIEAQKSTNQLVPGTKMFIKIWGKEEHEQHLKHHTHDKQSLSHAHYTYESVLNRINSLSLPENVKEDARNIYQIIGLAESKAHNQPLDNIHFHEVGSLDAIIDVIGCSYIINMLNETQIFSSPIHIGNGTVKCAHGVLEVPVPAVKEILKDIPYYKGEIMTELCTPTGAAIIKYYASSFTTASFTPDYEQKGIGLGNKTFEEPNIIEVWKG